MTNDKNLSKDSVRLKGVTKQIRLFFFKFPHSNAKKCCHYLKIPYKKYCRLCWKIKSETKQLLEGKVEGRVLVPLTHRDESWLLERLPRDVVEKIIFEAGKRRPGKLDPKPFDDWYVTPNRNRMMLLRNNLVTIRVWPKSGGFRVLAAKRVPYEWVKVAVQNALFKADVDLELCEKLSETIEPKSRTRIFKVGPVTPFQINHYKDPLGIIIKADASHPEFIEVPEEWPSWIIPFLTRMDRVSSDVGEVRKGQTDLNEVLPNRLEKIASSFEESMKEHLGIIEKFKHESEARSEVLKTCTENINMLPSKIGKAVLDGLQPLVDRQERNEKLLWSIDRKLPKNSQAKERLANCVKKLKKKLKK